MKKSELAHMLGISRVTLWKYTRVHEEPPAWFHYAMVAIDNGLTPVMRGWVCKELRETRTKGPCMRGKAHDGLSQRQLAQLFELSPFTISKYERSDLVPNWYGYAMRGLVYEHSKDA